MCGVLVAVALGAEARAAEPCRAPSGQDVGVTTIGGVTARQIESRGGGQGRWATWDVDRWLVFEDARCRTVGLRVSGGAGAVTSGAHFLALEGQAPPTRAEREHLLRWAGYAAARAQDATDALRRAPRLPAAADDAGETAGDDAPPDAGVGPRAARCIASAPVALPSAAVPFAMPRTAWSPERWSADALADSGVESFTASCPCFSVFEGERFQERGAGDGPSAAVGALAGLPDGTRLLHLVTGARNPTHALGLVDDTRKSVRWLGTHFGPLDVLGVQRGTLWVRTRGALDDGPPQVVALDPRAHSAQACRLDVGVERAHAVELSPAGIAVRERAGAAEAHLVPFETILAAFERARAQKARTAAPPSRSRAQ